MKTLAILTPLLCLVAVCDLQGAVSIAERRAPHDVALSQLVENPQAYRGMRVRFDATFIKTAGFFDSFRTSFAPQRSINIVVWDAQAPIWLPEARAEFIGTLFFDKERSGAQDISSIERYAQVRVIGEVQFDARQRPWINCHSIEPLRGTGRFTDNAIYHIEQGLALSADGAYRLADENFAKALEVDLPLYAQAAVLQMRGENLLQARRYDDAVEVLQAALRLFRSHQDIDRGALPHLHYMLAQAINELAGAAAARDQDAKPLFRQAVEHAQEAVRLDPAVGDAYAALGIALAGLSRWEEARQHCARAIRMLPENAEVRWYLGRIQDWQGDYDAAIETLRHGIDLAPQDYRLHKAIAGAYFNRHMRGGPQAHADLVMALREYDISIRLYPDDPDLYHFSGLVLERATDIGATVRLGVSPEMVPATYAMAIERFQQCLEVDPTYTEAHLRLAIRFQAEDRHDESVYHYQQVLALEPGRDALYAQVAGYLWGLERRSDAYDVLLRHHERHPQDLETLYALGRLSLELGEWQRGIEWHDRLLRLDRDHALAHVDQAQMHFEDGNLRQAERFAGRALDLLDSDDEQRIRAHRFKGLSHWAQGDAAATIAHLDPYIDDAGDHRMAEALGWAVSVDGDRGERVLEMSRLVSSWGGDDQTAAELLAWGHYQVGSFDQAEAVLKEVVFDDEDRRAYRLGMTLFQLGPERYEEAGPLLEQAARFNSREPHLRAVRTEARNALRDIRDHERQVARELREAERARARGQ